MGQEIAAGVTPDSSLIIDVAFWIIALSAIGSSIAVVQTRDLFRAALFLAAAFLSIAGLFVMLRAEFLAVVQVLIYVGAISVLIVFAVLTTRDVEHGNPSNMLRIPAAILALLFLAVASVTMLNTDWSLLSNSDAAVIAQSSVEAARGRQHGRQPDTQDRRAPVAGLRASVRGRLCAPAGDDRRRPRARAEGHRVSLENVLLVGAVIFAIGLYGALSKRSAITVLMSLELMFNAVNITAVALSRYVVPAGLAADPAIAADELARLLLTGQIFAIFIITVAAAEVALGVAIVIAVYRSRQTAFVTDANQMRH